MKAEPRVCRAAEWALAALWVAVKPQGAAFRRQRPDPLALLVEPPPASTASAVRRRKSGES